MATSVLVQSPTQGFYPQANFSVSGNFTDGGTITITDSLNRFGSKPNSPKPYFWLDASTDGLNPNLTLGRAGWRQSGFPRTSTGQLAPNSTASLHQEVSDGADGDNLPAIADFDGYGAVAPDWYLWRKVYHDFDPQQQYKVEYPITVSSGTPAAGQVITGDSSGVTGYVYYAQLDELHFDVSHPSSTVDLDNPFTNGETVRAAGDAVVGTIGLRYEYLFNWKYIRCVADDGIPDGDFVLPAGYGGSTSVPPPWDGQFDGWWETQGLYNSSNQVQTGYESLRVPYQEWHTDEFWCQQSSLDTADGYMQYGMNGVWPSNMQVCTRFVGTQGGTGAAGINRISLQQYSNGGGQPGTDVYYDALYVDDSLCRIFISDELSYQDKSTYPDSEVLREVCIPTAWDSGGGSITAILRHGAFASLTGKCLYVVDSSGNAYKIGQFS